jgi:hypothetical protein
MMTEAKQITTGNYAGDISDFYRRLNSLTGSKLDEHRVATTEALDKTAEAFAASQGGGGATDFQAAHALIRNPTSHLSNLGFDMITKQLKGNVELDKLKGELERDLKPGSQKLHDFLSEWNKHANPRVFQALMMTPEQRTYFLGAYRNPETHQWEPIERPDPNDPTQLTTKPLDENDTALLDDWWDDYQYAKEKGWLKNIRVVGAGKGAKPK